ncbi:hypothetical protein SVIO_073710 [Streptomyces violaceusniger]|uniref:Aromatic ring-opening dioxygenase LigA n=1 Tax=Streptomyces violaceusniger TaxID=68280 RepID=A0A4D4LE38_STRVO|nr:hypothetical protein SVIO_073710 [Streptomyces violaceusniger]
MAVAVALTALTGAFVWFVGSEDRALAGACDGVLPVGEVRSVLGDDTDLDVTNRTEGFFGEKAAKKEKDGAERVNSLSVHCRITAEDTGHIAVSIAGAPRPRAEYGYDGLYTAVPARHTLPVPLGHGWSGLFATDSARLDDAEDGTATTSVLLDCARRGDSLLITVETALRGAATLDDPAVRPDFVRTATATAEAANDHWGCGARLGKPVRTVGLPVNEDEYEPLLGAKGTCAAVPTASRSAVSTARETARDRAPREACVLGTRDGSPLYRLEAYYGPYAEDARSQYTRDYDYENVTPPRSPPGGSARAPTGPVPTARAAPSPPSTSSAPTPPTARPAAAPTSPTNAPPWRPSPPPRPNTTAAPRRACRAAEAGQAGGRGGGTSWRFCNSSRAFCRCLVSQSSSAAMASRSVRARS